MNLADIHSPADVKTMPAEQLNSFCDELREVLLKKLSEHGGHIGPNLGILEATVALHRVFDSPTDKIVFDVSHQCYVHKMLTGRMEAFLDPAHYDDVSGYTEPSESEHDTFIIGHTSTSISLACGLAKSRDLLGGKNNVIAVIGDGSLSGGEAYEGLNNAAEAGTNLIIVVNDNQMSIAENHGGLYRNLAELRESNGTSPNNFFKSLGFDYVYVSEGNNIHALIEAFASVKDSSRPVVVHINTLKGHGWKPAENAQEDFHWGMPFDLATGKSKVDFGDEEDYGDLTAEFLLEKMKTDSRIVGISAGTPTVMGFTEERRKRAGKQFVDVGIAEEHAVALASGIASQGGRPVFGVFSTFLQRTYDQLSQDLCINNNPAVILSFWGSLSSMNDVTHLCFFDIALAANIPNMVFLAPSCKEEYFAMLEWSLAQTAHPVTIRVPANGVISASHKIDDDYSDLNRYQVTKRGSKVAILALGSFYQLGESVVELLKANGIDGTLVNPRFASGVDTALLEELKRDHQLVVTLEDGVLDGGFGEKIARYYGPSEIKVLNFGAKKEFVDRFDLNEFLQANHLTPPQILADIQETLLISKRSKR